MSAIKKEKQINDNFCIDFHGAALIDEDGKEIAITEEMIEEACQKLQDDHGLTPYLDTEAE
jgi:hypothetical protein